MDLSFEVQTQGFFAFDSFLPENKGLLWKSQGSVGESLALECKEDELLEKAPLNFRKKNPSETRNVACLKSHCVAERRRRERINGHLTALRNFVTRHDKMDKATLLAEVISQVKELKKQASQATKGMLVPIDVDEVIVEPCNVHDAPDDAFTFKASVCFEYKPELIPDSRRAIVRLKLTLSKAEISTLGSRLKTVFIVTGCKDEIGYERREKFGKAIHKALSAVLESISPLEEYSPRTMYPSKRRRDCFFETSISSSSSPSL